MDAMPSRSVIVVSQGDDPRHTDLVKCLEGHGCQVECLTSPQDAILRLQRTAESGASHDAVLLQIRSEADGSLTGLDLLTEIREASPDTCIMAILEDDGIPHAGQAFHKGADAWVSQSMECDEVWYRLTSALAWRERPDAEKQLPDFLKHGLDVGISIIDRNFRILYANDYQFGISGCGVQVRGLCWAEYDYALEQDGPCPWCPVHETFLDGGSHTRTTISEKTDGIHFYDVKSLPIRDEKTGVVIAAVEVVRDITESMLRDCRAAALEGRDAFRKAMEDVLRRVCDLGFRRARLYVQTRDPRYMEAIAAWGPHDGQVVGLTVGADNYQHFREIKEASGIVYYDGSDPCPVHPAGWVLRDDGVPWLEVPLRGLSRGGEASFVGMMCVDNGRWGEENLTQNKEFWPLLEEYAELLGPIVKAAVDYWMRHERAQQVEILRELDLALAREDTAEQQMKSIVGYARVLLKPHHCHIRLLRGNDLVLMADTEVPSRIRPVVKVDDSPSVSAELARLPETQSRLIQTEEEVKGFADRLRAEGLSDTADHLDELRSCGAFKLVDSENRLIGTLVLDAAERYFFDAEKLSLTHDLVNRAQVLLESSLRHQRAQARLQQVEALLNAMPAEVAVLDEQGELTLCNRAWAGRVGVLSPPSGWSRMPYADAAMCIGADRVYFRNLVSSAFRRGTAQRMVASFVSTAGPRRMDVTAAPFEKDGRNVKTVAVILSDITDRAEVEKITEGAARSENLAHCLQKPVENIQRILGADQAGIAECLDFSGRDAPITIWCQIRRGKSVSVDKELIPPISGVGQIVKRLRESGYLAMSDVKNSPLFPHDIRRFFGKHDIRSLLAVPVVLDGEPWGVLGVAYERRRDFGGGDVDLLRTAAMQISLLVLLWQQMELRAIDKRIAAGVDGGRDNNETQKSGENGLLATILDQAIRLASCQDGHFRTIDWFNDLAVLEVARKAASVTKQLPEAKAELPLGTPVSGKVALSGEVYVVNDRKRDSYSEYSRDQGSSVESYQSYVCAPLIAADEILGTFSLLSDRKHHFTERRLRLLSDFASRAAMTLLAQQHLQRMTQMADLIDEILRVDRLEDLWPKIPEVAVRLFLCEDAAVSEYDHVTGLLCRKARHNQRLAQAPTGDVGHKAHPSESEGCGFTLLVAKTGQALRLAGDAVKSHPNRHDGNLQHETLLPSKELHSVMVRRLDTPDGRTVGVLKVENRKGRLDRRGFTEFDETLMSLVASKFAIAIDRLRLAEERSRTIARQAHDLKIPVQSMRGILGNFRTKRFTLPEHADAIEIGYQRSRLLEARITSMVDVVRGAITWEDVSPEDVATKELVTEVIDMFRSTCEEQDWHVQVDIDRSAETIYADSNEMVRLLANLMDNVQKHGFTPDAEGSEQAKEICISVTCDGGDEVVLAVADRGPGIPQRQREQLLQIGHEAGGDGATTRLGIGLKAIALIARAHQGEAQILDRTDGKTGAVVEVRWNQKRLREATGVPASGENRH